MHAEVLVELLILGPVVAHELFKLALYALFKVLAYYAKLSVMLEYFPGNIEREIGRIHDALDKLKVIVHELVALFHYHHAV